MSSQSQPHSQRPSAVPAPQEEGAHSSSTETNVSINQNNNSANTNDRGLHPTSSQTTQAQSPLDWANFMNFQTPPASQNGGFGARMPSSGSFNGNGGNGQRIREEEQYQSFAQGIAMNHSAASDINFQPPYRRSSSSSSQQQPIHHQQTQQPQQQQQYPHEVQYALPSQTTQQASTQTPARQSSISKGKSPAVRKEDLAPDTSRNPPSNASQHDNGLTLDPSAFSRDIRFQVPSFLSNQVGGAPAYPPGGEAWSGFAGAGLFGSADVGQLTPGSIFANAFGLGSQSSDNHGYSDNGGLGYMGGNAGWDNMSNDPSKVDGQNTYNMNPNLGHVFYVNPNPSPNILASRNPPTQSNMAYQARPGQQQQQTANRANNTSNTIQQSPLSTNNSRLETQPSPRINTGSFQSGPQAPQQQPTQSPHANSSGSGSMPTSAILPSAPTFQSNYSQPPMNFSGVPSMSAQMLGLSASTINIASSSTAPYAPPSNTQALLSGPMPPSLADGPGLYSTTGFDMVGVLARVAARKDPSTVLGPVDLSCSFLVVDVTRYDSPIVYASPTFSALTGYELPQILGRNCRFLQSPEGEVVKGSKRKYTDNTAVAHLKRMLNAGKECQASLINYRRGGVPFINLVTVVPIPWEGTDIRYHVGFQVDLVEQPNAILRNMRDGTYQVNYTVSNPPEKPLRVTVKEVAITGLSQEIMDIMGTRINSIASGQGEDAGKMEWLKMVLDNTDDFVHAVSLKGFFQYVSPSVARVLEYEPEELLNKNISEFAHPSDIVPLMRELKDSTHAPSDGQSARHVNLVFRIRRKNSGYIWIESVGRLVVEAGKGRKAVILSGRARSIPALPWDSVARHGGLAETEFWAKLSFQGLVLHSTAGVNDVLGQPSDDVVGHSFFSMLPGGDNGPPSSAVLQADSSSPVAAVSSAIRSVLNGGGETRHGAVSVQHKMVHKSGTQVNVVSIFYLPQRHISLLEPGSGSRMKRSSSDDSSGRESDSSDPSSSATTAMTSGIRPTTLVVQVKLLVAPAQTPPQPQSASQASTTIATLTNAKPVVHDHSANVFEELETTRGTSWQYELHQLRMLNRRLKEDINAARARGAGTGKNKVRKRKAEDGSMGPPPLPSQSAGQQEQYHAAPRHQLAPGFGLLTPGLTGNYY